MNPPATNPLFVYGTLMVPEVLTALLGRVPQIKAATLEGYRRFSVPGERYPAIVSAARSRVRGRLLVGLTASELAQLDAYEGDAYVRTEVALLVDGEVTPAACYVWRDPEVALASHDDWDVQAFTATELDGYLRGLK